MKPSVQKNYFPIFNVSKKAERNPQSSLVNTLNPVLEIVVKEINTEMEIEMSKDGDLNTKKADKRIEESKEANQNPQKKHNYSKDEEANQNIKDALSAYNSRNTIILLPNGKKKTVRNIADYYNVPKSTLNDRTKGYYSADNPPSLGRKPLFSSQEISDLVNHLLRMAQIGYGYTSIQLANLVRYLAENCKDKQNFKASRSFLANLFHKFPELTLRKASSYEYIRSKSLTIEIILQFFDVLEAAYGLVKDFTKKEIDPKDIWSLDEVGFKLNDSKNLFIVSKKGIKNVHAIKSSNSNHVSVIFCTNALGFTLPPYFLVKGKPKEDFLLNCKKSGFQSSVVFGTKNAFINFAAFNDFSKFFVEKAKFNDKTASVLILDGHNAHTLNLDALEFLNKNKVFSVCIPAHTSQAFNIGDRTVFGCLKKYWRQACHSYIQGKRRDLLLEDFPLIFKEAWPKSLNQFGIIKGNFFFGKLFNSYYSFCFSRNLSFK